MTSSFNCFWEVSWVSILRQIVYCIFFSDGNCCHYQRTLLAVVQGKTLSGKNKKAIDKVRKLPFWELNVLPWKYLLFENSVLYHENTYFSRTQCFTILSENAACQSSFQKHRATELSSENTGAQHPSMSTEAYLEPSQISMMEHFCENS